MDTFLTIREAAERLAVHPDTIRRAIWRRDLSHYRMGRAVRIRTADLDAWVARVVVPALPAINEEGRTA